MRKKIDWDIILIISVLVWAAFLVFVFLFDFYKHANKDELSTENSKIIVQDFESEIPIPNITDVNELTQVYSEWKESQPVIDEPAETEFISYYSITDNDRYVVEHLVAGEAGHELFLGKMAVAQCILNAMKQDDLTASEVRKKYGYSGWAKENFEINYPEDWAEVQQAVWCVFDNGEKVTEENILWFYAPKYSSGSWHRTQKFVIEIGGHLFYAPWN